jgi:hypothetical protein
MLRPSGSLEVLASVGPSFKDSRFSILLGPTAQIGVRQQRNGATGERRRLYLEREVW